MAGRNHHTIPRFLLNGFGTSRRKKIVYVWMYRKDSDAIQLNAENVATERDFYGGNEDDEWVYQGHPKLDDRITDRENDYREIIRKLRDCPVNGSPVPVAGIPALIAHLSIRNRQFRQSLEVDWNVLTEKMSEALLAPENRNKIVERLLGSDSFRTQLEARLISAGRSVVQANDAIRQVLGNPEMIRELLNATWEESEASARGYISGYRSGISDAVRAAHISVLSKTLDDVELTRLYDGHNWFLSEIDDLVLLGDCACIFETDGERRYRSFPDAADRITRIYLPISSSRIVVGASTIDRPQVNLSKLNRAIARCSYEFFIASRQLSAGETHLHRAIGLWAGLLGRKEFNEIVEAESLNFGLRRHNHRVTLRSLSILDSDSVRELPVDSQ